MKKTLLVHLHLYYIEQLDYFIKKLSNIQSVSHDLYITMVEKNDEVEQKILSRFPNANILVVSNKGYDVGPFIHILNNIDIDCYNYVLKVHTKNTTLNNGDKINGVWISRKCWMPLLVEALIGTPKIFADNIKKFEDNHKIGMIGSKYLITPPTRSCNRILPQIKDTIKSLGFKELKNLTFVAGTMFMMRSSLLKPIIKAGYNIDSFAQTGRTCGTNGLPHIFERVFGALVNIQNFIIYGSKDASFYTKVIFYKNHLKNIFLNTKTSNFLKKLFYKKSGSTEKYKLFGLTLIKIIKKPQKMIIKVLGIKFTNKPFLK